MSVQQRQHTQPALIQLNQSHDNVLPLDPVDLFKAGSTFDEAWLRDLLFRYPKLIPFDEIEPVFGEQG